MSFEGYITEVIYDKPKSGMWHCGPNNCWVKVTHKETGISATAYNRLAYKARDSARAVVDMLIEDMGNLSEPTFLENLEA